MKKDDELIATAVLLALRDSAATLRLVDVASLLGVRKSRRGRWSQTAYDAYRQVGRALQTLRKSGLVELRRAGPRGRQAGWRAIDLRRADDGAAFAESCARSDVDEAGYCPYTGQLDDRVDHPTRVSRSLDLHALASGDSSLAATTTDDEATRRQTNGAPRLEDRVELRCCGRPARLAGNLALRGAGSPVTRLAYECVHCRRRLQVVDDWDRPDAGQLAVYDETP